MAEALNAAVEVRYITVAEADAGQRIDNFLIRHLKGVPKSRLYRLMRRGEVRVNKGRIKPEYRLLAGDSIRVPPIRVGETPVLPTPGLGLRRQLEERVLFETEELLVIDKPPGMAVHGGSGISLGLIEALRLSRDDANLELVHRLDRGTSGCLLVAKTRGALRSLQSQLREHRVDKVYLALVDGNWPKGLDQIDAPLNKTTTSSGEKMVRPSPEGKHALTLFSVRGRYAGATLLDVTLQTGRTHQIRVHCQLVGHPLLGDDKYGSDQRNHQLRALGLKRLFLHAHRLTFCLPASGQTQVVESPLPVDLQQVLQGL